MIAVVADRIFDPDRMPPRDEDGWVYHPDLDNMVVDGEDGDELPLDPKKLTAAGFEDFLVLLDGDVDESHPAFDEYFTEQGGCSKWEPTVPPAAGWQLVAIYDTDSGNGPVAMFVRPIP